MEKKKLTETLSSAHSYTSINMLRKEIGFQNPVQNDSFDLDRKASVDSIDETLDESHENLKLHLRKFSSAIHSNKLHEIDVLCCDKVFTIKTKTYLNYKNCLDMLKPFVVLIFMVAILLAFFRIDLFLTTEIAE